MEEIVMTDAELLRRIDQMAMELERLRQQVLGSMAAQRQREKFKSVQEYEACGMWADREDWQGLSTEECLAQIREKAWGDPLRWRGEYRQGFHRLEHRIDYRLSQQSRGAKDRGVHHR